VTASVPGTYAQIQSAPSATYTFSKCTYQQASAAQLVAPPNGVSSAYT
jgi:hypothetical protein